MMMNHDNNRLSNRGLRCSVEDEETGPDFHDLVSHAGRTHCARTPMHNLHLYESRESQDRSRKALHDLQFITSYVTPNCQTLILDYQSGGSVPKLSYTGLPSLQLNRPYATGRLFNQDTCLQSPWIVESRRRGEDCRGHPCHDCGRLRQ